MARIRKTIDVEAVKASANKALSDPATTARQDKTWGEAQAVAFRTGIAMVLETVLTDTGNYKGFRYADLDHGNTDSSKRAYY